MITWFICLFALESQGCTILKFSGANKTKKKTFKNF